MNYDRLEHDFPTAIRLVVDGMLNEGVPKVAEVAEAVGGSVRTIQRRLAELGSSYSDIIQAAKMKSANTLIACGEYSFTEIAYKLGYSDQAHFTRAFRRWNGMSPREFRTLQKSGLE